MFKVICINAVPDPEAEAPCDLIEGEVYTVIDYYELSYGKNLIIENKPCYKLAEKNPKYGYCVKRFIPLSNIDELELVNEKEQVHS